MFRDKTLAEVEKERAAEMENKRKDEFYNALKDGLTNAPNTDVGKFTGNEIKYADSGMIGNDASATGEKWIDIVKDGELVPVGGTAQSEEYVNYGEGVFDEDYGSITGVNDFSDLNLSDIGMFADEFRQSAWDATNASDGG